MLRRLVCVLCLMFVLAVPVCVEAAEVPEFVNIGVFMELNPELIVEYEKLYEHYLGTKANLVIFSTSAEINQAIAGGSIDIGVIGTTGAALGISNGLGYETFWISYVIGSSEALVVHPNQEIQSLSDLIGKKVAVPFAGTTHYCLLNALVGAGVDPARVKLLNMKPAEINAAWRRGDIDATYIWYPLLGQLLDSGGKVLITSEDLVKQGVITADVQIVNKDFAKKYPNILVNYIRAQMYALNKYNNDYDSAIKEMAAVLGLDETTARELSRGFAYPTAEEQLGAQYFGTKEAKANLAEVLRSTAQFFAEQGMLSVVPPLETFQEAVTGEFIERALAEK